MPSERVACDLACISLIGDCFVSTSSPNIAGKSVKKSWMSGAGMLRVGAKTMATAYILVDETQSIGQPLTVSDIHLVDVRSVRNICEVGAQIG